MMEHDEEMYCIVCHGRGLDAKDEICGRCHGSGYEPEFWAEIDDLYNELMAENVEQ